MAQKRRSRTLMGMRQEMAVFYIESDSSHLYGKQLRGKIVVFWRLIFMTLFSNTIITLTEQSGE